MCCHGGLVFFRNEYNSERTLVIALHYMCIRDEIEIKHTSITEKYSGGWNEDNTISRTQYLNTRE